MSLLAPVLAQPPSDSPKLQALAILKVLADHARMPDVPLGSEAEIEQALRILTGAWAQSTDMLDAYTRQFGRLQSGQQSHVLELLEQHKTNVDPSVLIAEIQASASVTETTIREAGKVLKVVGGIAVIAAAYLLRAHQKHRHELERRRHEPGGPNGRRF